LINLSKLNNLFDYKKDGNKKITAIIVQGNKNISKDLIISQITSNLGDVFSKEIIEKDRKEVYDLGYFKDVSIKIEPFRDGYKVIFVVIEYLSIKEINIEGNTIISKDLIISQITSNLGDVFSKKNIEKDMKAIYDLGYFKDVKTKIEPFRDGYKVIFVVIEYLSIKEINIEGNTAVSEEEMREVMVLQEGQIFCQKILKNDLNRISQLYKDRGYLLINIKDVNFDEQGKLWITISEGRLGKILVEGNHKTKEQVIAQEISINPGDLFDFEKVKKSLQKIYNLGYFEDVTMKLETENEESAVVLIIKIVEKSKIRNNINFLLKNVLASFFLLSVYMRLFLPKWFYKITDYLPSNINLFIKSYIFMFITFSFVIILSSFFLEKRFDRKDKLRYFVSYFGYLFLFPLIIIYKIINFSIFNILGKIIDIFSNIFKITKNNFIQILLFFGDLVLIYLIWGSSNNIVIIFSMFTVMISLIFHIDYFFNLVINPNLIYLSLYNFVEKWWTFWEKSESKKINKKNDIKDIKIQNEGLKIFIKGSAKFFNILKKQINISHSRKGILFAFIVFFVISILFTIIIFSFEYYGLSKIDNNNFSNLVEGKYFEHLFFSMTIYSTVNPGDIFPLTMVSKLFIMLQILMGIVLFYIFIVSFQATAFKLATAGKKDILKRIELKLNYLDGLAESEFNKNLDNL